MCGIVCGETPNRVTHGQVSRALATLAHRGPSGAATIAFGDVFLAHTRLTLVGAERETQPMSNEAGTIFASVNGEFQGFESLRNDLQARGHTFKTQRDSEVLVHLYEEQGTDCLKQLHGEFAFALYDQNKRRWFCARDRMGVRPLQYHQDGDRFLIASEAKALFALGLTARLNRKSIGFSQHVQCPPQTGTLFEGVHMIPPGCFILVDQAGLALHKYGSLNDFAAQPMSFNEAKARTADLLTLAMQRREPSEFA